MMVHKETLVILVHLDPKEQLVQMELMEDKEPLADQEQEEMLALRDLKDSLANLVWMD